MNVLHRLLCSSARLKTVVETYILPWTLEGVNLGSNVLEIGPGPGISTDLLRPRVAHLTCVEADRETLEQLRLEVDTARVDAAQVRENLERHRKNRHY